MFPINQAAMRSTASRGGQVPRADGAPMRSRGTRRRPRPTEHHLQRLTSGQPQLRRRIAPRSRTSTESSDAPGDPSGDSREAEAGRSPRAPARLRPLLPRSCSCYRRSRTTNQGAPIASSRAVQRPHRGRDGTAVDARLGCEDRPATGKTFRWCSPLVSIPRDSRHPRVRVTIRRLNPERIRPQLRTSSGSSAAACQSRAWQGYERRPGRCSRCA
jgi:hypothetical protein